MGAPNLDDCKHCGARMTQMPLALDTDPVAVLHAALLVYARRARDVAYYWANPVRRRAQRLKSKHKTPTWREHSRGWA